MIRCFLLSLLCLHISAAEPGTLTLRILEEAALDSSSPSKPLPCRIHLKDRNNNAIQVPGYPFWDDHMVCDGTLKASLPAGHYDLEIERGPEYSARKWDIIIEEGKAQTLTLPLGRIADLATYGWWSGETHLHRPIELTELLMQAEDLHVAHCITWWNEHGATESESSVRQFNDNYFYQTLCGEDEREGGALLYLTTQRPLAISKALDHFPPSSVFAHQARKIQPDVWIDAEKSFWWDLPLWLSENLVNTIGIANNHMNRRGMLDDEVRGRPRDRQSYPSPLGNGHWTQEIYYHVLNCGLRIAPSAGSASGVLNNPVGYNRIYAYVNPDEFSYEKWVHAVKTGRTFVTNGPLLRCTAGGELPGHVFKSGNSVRLDVKLTSRDKVEFIELVQNGKVVRKFAPDSYPGEVQLKPGWFLLRCMAHTSAPTFRFACTAPFYVEGPHISKSSAQFFVDWCKARMEKFDSIPAFTPEQKAETLELWKKVSAFWENKVAAANAE